VISPAKDMAKLVMDLDVFMPLREEVIKDGGNL
jgi:hypothetical protein